MNVFDFDAQRYIGEDETACPRCGRDSCEGCAESVRSNSTQCTRFRSAADVMRDPAPEAVIEGLLYRVRNSVVVAESGAGKSFMVASWAGAIADPGVSTWAGREVSTGSVALVLFERDAVGLRLRALAEQGHDLTDLHVLLAADPLSPVLGRDGLEIPSPGELALVADLEALRAKLQASGRPPVVALFVDTVRASMAGAEESSRDTSAYLRAIDRIAKAAPGAAVGLVHHTGWLDGDAPRKRERGSSAFRGNVDVTLMLEVDGEQADPREVRLVLRCLKNRDEERGAPIRLIRRRVVLNGFDAKGKLVTSCVIERDPRTAADLEAEVTAAQEAADRELDLRVLRAIHDHAPTSIDALRMVTRTRRDTVYASVSRLVSARLANQARRGEPYLLSPEGLRTIGEDPSSHRPRPSPNRPRDASPNRPTVPPPIGADGTNGDSRRLAQSNRPRAGRSRT